MRPPTHQEDGLRNTWGAERHLSVGQGPASCWRFITRRVSAQGVGQVSGGCWEFGCGSWGLGGGYTCPPTSKENKSFSKSEALETAQHASYQMLSSTQEACRWSLPISKEKPPSPPPGDIPRSEGRGGSKTGRNSTLFALSKFSAPEEGKEKAKEEASPCSLRNTDLGAGAVAQGC